MRYTISIRKKSGRYYARVYDRRTRERKEISLGTRLKESAQRRAKSLEKRLDSGECTIHTMNPSAPDLLTVRQAVDAFKEDKAGTVRKKTLRCYTSVLSVLQERQHLDDYMPIESVQLDSIRPFLDETDVSVSTRLHRYRHLNVFFNYLVEEGALQNNPLDDYSPPKKRKKVPAFLSAKDLELLLKKIDEHKDKLESGHKVDRSVPKRPVYKESKHVPKSLDFSMQWLKDVILLAVSTGMRRGELCNLTWSMVDLDSGFIHLRNTESFQTKSGNERSIPLLADGLEVITRLRSEHPDAQPTDPVLTTNGSSPLPATYVSKQFKLFVRLAGLDERISLHNLRHTCASWLAMKGIPMGMISKLLGHSSTAITEEFYAHFTNESIREALADALRR